MPAMFALVLAAAMQAAPDSLPTIQAATPIPIRDAFTYRVGLVRRTWRTDYVVTTVIRHGDTLARNLLNSQMGEFAASTDLPDTAQLVISIGAWRFEHGPQGQVRRGPYFVRSVDPDWIELRQTMSLACCEPSMPTAPELPDALTPWRAKP